MFNYNRLSQATPEDLAKMYGDRAPAAAPKATTLAFKTLPGTTGKRVQFSLLIFQDISLLFAWF